MLPFDRPVGAQRDVKELEFISALMQTGNGLRADGSIEASDIVFYLCSRHGLTVDECTVQDLILRQLAGPTTQAEKPVLDLCQFVALLLIPKFLEACQDKDLSQKLLHPFVTTLQSFQDDQGKLSRDALREMLANYDEFVTDDELLDDMIAIIDGSLLDALSSDVGIYDLSWKNHYTTHLEDATAVEKDSVEKAPNHAVPFHRFFTASFIDYSADTYRRPLYVACLFACGIINYFAYVFGTDDGSWAEVNCGKMSELVCGLVQGLVSWAAIMVQLTTLGIFFIAFGSLGNGLSTCKTWLKFMGSVLSIGVIYLTTITPYFVNVETAFFDTSGNKNYVYEDSGDTEEYDKNRDISGAFYILSLTLGAILLTYLVVDTGAIFFPKSWLAESSVISALFTPAGLRAESAQKKASSFKISKMIENALSLHLKTGSLKSSTMNSIYESRISVRSQMSLNAMSNFQAQELLTEKVGGALWAWKKILNGSIFVEEGIWLHSRLVVGNLLQLIVFIIVIFLAYLGFKNSDQFVYSESPTVAEQGQAMFDGLVATTLNCTNEAFQSVGGRYSFNAWSATSLWTWAYQFDAGSNNATMFGQVFENITADVILDCFMEAPFESDRFLEIDSLFNCVDGLIQEGTITPQDDKYGSQEELFADFVTPADLFRLQWVVKGGYKELNNYFRECNATDELISYINATSYDSVAENEGVLASMAEALQLSQTGYYSAITVGFMASALTIMYLALIYIPSFISTVLRFRSGVLPSLRESAILYYRPALDTVTVLFGAVFWGALFTTITVGAVFGGIVAIFASQYGEDVAMSILSPIAGFALILVIKIVVLILLRNLFFKNFYRKKPAAANLFFLVMEVWNVALSVGYIIMRVIKIILISLFYIARFDEPFLAPGVGRIGAMELDGFSLCFRKDLLLHEAHRHPYIEQFGLLCLLKLQHREKFGARANACWRLLYVLSIMPWMKKYRVRSSYEDPVETKGSSTIMQEYSDGSPMNNCKEVDNARSSPEESPVPAKSNGESVMYEF